jgi:hypothetical protein
MENVDKQVMDKIYSNFREQVWGVVASNIPIKIYFKLRDQINTRLSNEVLSQVKQNMELWKM